MKGQNTKNIDKKNWTWCVKLYIYRLTFEKKMENIVKDSGKNQSENKLQKTWWSRNENQILNFITFISSRK